MELPGGKFPSRNYSRTRASRANSGIQRISSRNGGSFLMSSLSER